MISKAQQRRYEEIYRPAYDALMKFYPLTLDDLDGELWKPVPDYEDYQISNFGRVKSFCFGKVKIKKPDLRAGYLSVTLSKDSKLKHFPVHRLVALTFISNPDLKPQVNHRDGCKLNNYVENLEWVTRSENQRHAVATGLKQSGEDLYNSKLTNKQVEYIRENPDGLTGVQLAEKFGVSETTISLIQLGKKYRNVGGSVRGKKESSLKVPNEIRAKIRAEYKKGKHDCGSYALAKKYGVDPTTIWKIVKES